MKSCICWYRISFSVYRALLTGKGKYLPTRTQAFRSSCKSLCPDIESFFSNTVLFQLRHLAGVGSLVCTLIYLPIRSRVVARTDEQREAAAPAAECIPLFLHTNDFFTSPGGELHAKKSVLCSGKCPFRMVWVLQEGRVSPPLPAGPHGSPSEGDPHLFKACFMEDSHYKLLESNLKLIVKHIYLHSRKFYKLRN